MEEKEIKNKKVDNTKKTKTKPKFKIKDKKRLLIVCSVVLVILAIIIAVVVIPKGENKKVIKTATNNIDMNNTENVEIIDGKKVNNSEEMKYRKYNRDLTFEIIELTATESESKVVMEVTNESEEEFSGKEITIIFMEKEGRVYGELASYVGKIDAGKTIRLELTTTLDITNAYDYMVDVMEDFDDFEELENPEE